MTTHRKSFLSYTLSILLLTLFIVSCNKKENKSTSVFNGYKVDGIAYNMDSMRLDASGILSIRSGDNGGGTLYIRRNLAWPGADGVYEYYPWLNAVDTAGVEICFQHDTAITQYCSGPGATLQAGMQLTISAGKWTLMQSAIMLENGNRKILEITASQ